MDLILACYSLHDADNTAAIDLTALGKHPHSETSAREWCRSPLHMNTQL